MRKVVFIASAFAVFLNACQQTPGRDSVSASGVSEPATAVVTAQGVEYRITLPRKVDWRKIPDSVGPHAVAFISGQDEHTFVATLQARVIDLPPGPEPGSSSLDDGTNWMAQVTTQSNELILQRASEHKQAYSTGRHELIEFREVEPDSLNYDPLTCGLYELHVRDKNPPSQLGYEYLLSIVYSAICTDIFASTQIGFALSERYPPGITPEWSSLSVLRASLDSRFVAGAGGAAALREKCSAWAVTQPSDAIAACTEAIRLAPEVAHSYRSRGLAYFNSDQYRLAVEDYDRAIRLGPGIAFDYRTRGGAHLGLGQYQLAIEDVDRAIRLKPDQANYYFIRMVSRCRLGQADEAMVDLMRQVELDASAANMMQKILSGSGHYTGQIGGEFGIESQAAATAWIADDCPD